jgi:4-amino-4-deoxy-L-arabinose transferase-like glycosyltransferase
MSAVGNAVGLRGRSAPQLRNLVRGRAEDATWVRPALIALLAGTAVLYLAGLAANGWANAFYSAAVQASTKSWKAFFFGSSDSSNFITVDKPPASLWVMGISARIFGVNSWSILVPQALEGIASVALLYAAVRRWFTPAAGLLAGAALALTPVAVLMFRFNNPDAQLTLLLIGSAYALTRAVEKGQTRWPALAGALIGFGFLTKMLQALIVVPGFVLVYLVLAPTPVRRRLLQLLAAGGALFLSAAWWVAIVALWPASSRPYIGGSQDNSILNLILGYNGFGRLTGNESGSVVGGGGAGSAGQWGPTGITRMFNAEMGTQISWLLPAALCFGVATLWLGRHAKRTDVRRAAILVWSSWLVVTALVLSYAQGIIHPYYMIVLAPPIAALFGIGVTSTWAHRELLVARAAFAAAIGGTAIWAYVLLDRTPAWHPWLRVVVLCAGLAAATLALAPPSLRLARIAALLGVASALAAPAAYAVQTAATAHTGALPTAGPAGASVMNRGGFGRGGFGGGGFAPPAGGGGFGGPPGNFGGRGGLGGLLGSSTPSTALVALLQKGAGSYTWVAAAVGSNSAAGPQLASGEPVMAIGGFNGTDPTPTLAQFKQLVAAGKIHYFLAGGGRGGSSSSSGSIAAWVAGGFSSRTVGGTTVYDLTAPVG